MIWGPLNICYFLHYFLDVSAIMHVLSVTVNAQHTCHIGEVTAVGKKFVLHLDSHDCFKLRSMGINPNRTLGLANCYWKWVLEFLGAKISVYILFWLVWGRWSHLVTWGLHQPQNQEILTFDSLKIGLSRLLACSASSAISQARLKDVWGRKEWIPRVSVAHLLTCPNWDITWLRQESPEPL